MNALNMDYGMREPSLNEVHSAFGSYREAVNCTGGHLPSVLFYINNPTYPKTHGAPRTESRFAQSLYEAAKYEDRAAAFEANVATAKELWAKLKEQGNRQTVTSVALSMGVARRSASRFLSAAGVRS